ncbi:MAG TPA: family 10 glycosylhydrolase [Clostridiales bacterium]|nr:family 10 glycosylhydrolase [Clostridiales bacterium]
MMKRLLNRTATLLLMVAMFLTLASANVCAYDPVAADAPAAEAKVTEAALKNAAVLHANTILANNTGSKSIAAQSSQVSEKKEMRGLWVATVVNIDYPSKPTTDPEVLKKEAIEILDTAKDTGLNAVFLQVRPTADAFYKSKIFPWSKFLTGTQGKAPDNGFDPLAFWIEEAHARGIELHAWINPFRITKKTASEAKPTISSLHSSHPARKNPGWVVQYSDGNLYFDPGIPEVRKLIVDGIMELVNNYDIDGIHFDDYFYPGRDFNDSRTYAAYGKGFKNIGDWRRDNINKLVSDVYKAVKSSGKDIRFGISPFGIWANKKNNSLGSDTNGLETYYDHFADSRKWVKDGIVDYICPQLYWNIGYKVADYSKLLTWWKDVVSGTSVDLYIGHAAYKTGNTDKNSPWYGVAEIERQLLLNRNYPEVKGSLFYNYTSLAKSPALRALIKGVYDRLDGKTTEAELKVSWPSKDITTSYTQYYLTGASDPSKPLYINGKLVESRSPKGYFGVLVELGKGANTFTFSQEGAYVTRTITRSAGSSSATKMSKAEIIASSVFPQSQEYRMPGEKITLSCQAPAGAKVTVKIGGKTYNMTTASKSGGLYKATFTYTYTIPSYTGSPRVIDLGAPVYTMNYNGTVKSVTAPGKVGVIMQGAPFYAEVKNEDIDTFETPNSSNGAAYELRKGMVDYLTGMTGDYARLASGLWVRKTSISTYTSKTALSPRITSAVYKTGEKWDTLKLTYQSSLAATASFDGSKLKVNISAAASGVIPSLPSGAPFSTATFTKNGHIGQYVLTLKPGAKIEGYYIEKVSDGIIIHIKRPVKASSGDRPLEGITIMLDPGHGGSDTGATGPLGTEYPEKKINLENALLLKEELEKRGAKVLMTRTTDVYVSLSDRLTASRNAKPDMFLSIHANSMAENVDISQIEGFSAHYKEAIAKSLSQALCNAAAAAGRKNRGIKWANFYVVRGTWAPSMLIEVGFVPNPKEFEILTNEVEQKYLATKLADAIVEYFSGKR